ncbi:MAG: hypothetical protein M0P69_11215 [Bacteroidales bacterium]|nr:hypothetical protein [Bacteroidales bacterium]
MDKPITTNFENMDISIDTLIYIVIGVVFVLAQVIRRRKAVQSAEAVPVEPPPVEREEDPEDFWKKFLGVDELTGPKPESITQSPAGQTNDPEPFSSQWNQSAGRRRVTVAPVPSLTDQSVSPDDTESGLQDKGEKEEPGFDLRSAVIHSVILERKYV